MQGHIDEKNQRLPQRKGNRIASLVERFRRTKDAESMCRSNLRLGAEPAEFIRFRSRAAGGDDARGPFIILS